MTSSHTRDQLQSGACGSNGQGIETLVRNSRSDCNAALESVKEVYRITDTLTGKRDVGWACSVGVSGRDGAIMLRQDMEAMLDYVCLLLKASIITARILGSHSLNIGHFVPLASRSYSGRVFGSDSFQRVDARA